MSNPLGRLISAGIGLLLSAAPVAADEVTTLAQSEMQAHHVAGLACLVLKNDQPIASFCGGSANLEWPSHVDTNTVFEIGSVSKQFAAASILLLAESGRLSLDDSITRYLPSAPAAWQPIKVRHLLSHTSGLPTYDGLAGFEMRQHLTQAQFIARLATRPRAFAPGTKWLYCNSGYNLLGYMVENVSGQSYWDFLQRHIFAPLQMTHTTRRDPWLVVPQRATGYVYTNGGYVVRDNDLTDLFAAGAIVSTVSDLAKWDGALLDGTLLSASSRQAWWTAARLNRGSPVTSVQHGESGSYGLGWFINTVNGHRNIGHTGITSGFSAANELYPDDHLAIIVLANTDEGYFSGDLARQIARRLLPPVSGEK